MVISPLYPAFYLKQKPKNWTQINKNRIISTFFGLILHIEKVPYFTSKTPFSPHHKPQNGTFWLHFH